MTEKELFKLCVKEFSEVERAEITLDGTFEDCFDYYKGITKTDEDLLEDDYFIIQTPHLDCTMWRDGDMATLALTIIVYRNRETGVKEYSDVLITDIEGALERGEV